MELAIQSGKTQKMTGVSRFLLLAAAMALGAVGAYGQPGAPSCTTSAINALVHPEGLAEKVGDVTLTCSGGSGAVVTPTLYVGLQNANITNIFDSTGGVGITVSLNTIPISATVTVNGQTIVVSGLSFSVPSGGQAQVTVSGIRASVASVPGLAPVTANVGATGLNVSSSLLTVATPSPTASIYSSFLSSPVPCNGSPLPPVATPSLTDFVNGTSFSTLRVSEGWQDAFTKRDTSLPNGTRVIVSLSGYPAGARIFVPDVVVGNTGSVQTSAGAFGVYAGSGYYAPFSNQLLLSRVAQADATGTGGNPILATAPASLTPFGNMSEIALSGGAALLVYEVIDSSALVRENFQLPVFVVAPAATSCTVSQPSAIIKLGPISTDANDDQDAPVPRYISAVASSDCSLQGDCNAGYFPTLSVDTTPIVLTGIAYGPVQNRSLTVFNNGQGTLTFTVGIAYSGTGAGSWLKVTPAFGTNTTGLNIVADPSSLVPGAYSATITINAGQYGSQSIPVTFTVGAPGPTIQSVVSAATFLQGGPLTAGSIASLYGINLNGKNVTITFDGLPATVFGVYTLAGTGTALQQQQINILVPAGLSGKTTSQVVGTIDGVPTNSFTVTLVQNSPGVFNPGILNQNFSVNSASSPAKTGTIVAAYMTGLTVPLTGQVTVKIGATDFLIPQYAGAAPTLSGVQQINVLIPTSLTFTGNSSPFQVCIPALDPTQRVCSPAVTLYLTQ
jgi:uncharacterized protein (TIGR03437 family)